MQPLKTVGVILITALVAGGITFILTKNESTVSVEPQDIATSSSPSLTGTSKEYAVMGRELWSALQCAAWASKAEEEGQEERLFTYGYEQGKRFLKALEAGKIEQEDISNEVPIGVTWLLQGPTHEFILGRLYESSYDDALKEVFKTDEEFNSDELQKIIAADKFRGGNCELIGKNRE